MYMKIQSEKNETYKELLKDASINVKTDYKDRLFKFIFRKSGEQKVDLFLWETERR